MKLKNTKWGKWVVSTIGALIAGGAIMLGGVVVGYPAISQLVGLAVAQSSTLWNSVVDAAKGDALSSGILGQSPYLWNGVTFDRQYGSITNGARVDVTRMSGSVTPADAYANPTTANQMWSLNGVFNGTTWDRMRTASADALAITGMQASGQMGWNGASNDRVRTASATNNVAATSLGVQQVTPISTWSVINTTAGATAATISKALGGGTVRHVATGVTICFGDTVVAVTPLLVNLRDGATGAGTILRTWLLSSPTAGGTQCENVTGLNMTGLANTAMTLEFAAAPAATASETVTLTGYSIP